MASLLSLGVSEQIRSRPCPVCYLCGAPGELLHEGVRDMVFEAPGLWNFRVCPNASCGLMWLDPKPVEEDIGKAYEKYYTHADFSAQRGALSKALRGWASVLSSVVDPIYGERKNLSLMYLGNVKPGKMLDVGCGNGVRLARLRSLGWDVFGQDVDPMAVAHAREAFGLKVHLGRLE